MNTIIVDEYENKLKDIDGTLKMNCSNAHIHLYGTNHISKIQMPNDTNLMIDIEDNAILNFNVTLEQIKQLKIMVNSKNQTEFNCHIFIETNHDFDMEFQNNLIGNNNKSNIQIHAVAVNDEKIKIKTTGRIEKNTLDNEFLEELKGLTIKKETITFIPELIVDTNSVTANHNATIKCIGEEELFYLESKGILKEDAIELIKNGFLNKYEK